MKDFHFPEHLQVQREIGRGASGTVYAAWDSRTKKSVAVKVIRLSGKFGEKEHEAVRKYRQLHHPDLIPICDFLATDEYLLYTMPLADRSLDQCGKLPVDECRRLGVALLNGLELLHNTNFIHRDIKPENILILDNHYLLGDPGLISPAERTSFAGTPGFVHPDVLQQKKCPDKYCDLYALGKVLYCVLTGNDAAQFPQYSGSDGKEEAELMQLILPLCSAPETFSIPQLRTYLLHPGMFLKKKAERKKWRKRICCSLILIPVIACAAFSAVFCCKNRPEEISSDNIAAVIENKSETTTQTETKIAPDDETPPPEVMALFILKENWKIAPDPTVQKAKAGLKPYEKKIAILREQYAEIKRKNVKTTKQILSSFTKKPGTQPREMEISGSNDTDNELFSQYKDTIFYQFHILEEEAETISRELNFIRTKRGSDKLKLKQLEKLAAMRLKKDYSDFISPNASSDELRENIKRYLLQERQLQEKLISCYRKQQDLLQQTEPDG